LTAIGTTFSAGYFGARSLIDQDKGKYTPTSIEKIQSPKLTKAEPKIVKGKNNLPGFISYPK
jgi:hypothetical protein